MESNDRAEPMLLDFDEVVCRLGKDGDDDNNDRNDNSDNASTSCDSVGELSLLSGISLSDESVELLQIDVELLKPLLEPVPYTREHEKIEEKGLPCVDDDKTTDVVGDEVDEVDSQHHCLVIDRLKMLLEQESGPCAVSNYMQDATECSGTAHADRDLRGHAVAFMYAYIDEHNMRRRDKNTCRRRAASVALSYLDRLLSNETPAALILILQDKRRYWLAVTACLFLALEANGPAAPEVGDSFLCSFLCSYLGGSFASDVDKEKMRVLLALEWRLNGPIADDYIGLFLELVRGSKDAGDAISRSNDHMADEDAGGERHAGLLRMGIEDDAEETQRAREALCSKISRKAHEVVELSLADHLLVGVSPSAIAMAAISSATDDVSSMIDSSDMWSGALTCFGIINSVDVRSEQVSLVQERLRDGSVAARITHCVDSNRKAEAGPTGGTFGRDPEPTKESSRTEKKPKEKKKKKKRKATKRRPVGMKTGGRISQHRPHPRDGQWQDTTDDFGYDGSRPHLPWMELPNGNYVCGYGKAFDVPYLNRELEEIGIKYSESKWQRVLQRNGCGDDHLSPNGARQKFDLLKKLRWSEKKTIDGAI